MKKLSNEEKAFMEKYLLPTVKIHSTVTKEEDEAAWLLARKSGIGGSDIGAISGINPYTSARQIYLDKTDQMPDNLATKMNERMHFGNVLEPVVASEYARRSGNVIHDIPMSFSSLELPIALANCDRFIWNDERGPGILECKTADKYTEKSWKDGPLPTSYIYQLQWYLYVTGFAWGNLSCLLGGNTFYSYDIQRDDVLIGEMVETAKSFWLNNVQSLVEPPLTGSMFDTELSKQKEIKEDAVIFEDENLDNLGDEYIRVSQELKDLTEYKKLLNNRIKEALGTASYGVTVMHAFKQTKVSTSRVDANKLLEFSPQLYEYCLNTSEYIRLNVE